jgi:hypothetical protein
MNAESSLENMVEDFVATLRTENGKVSKLILRDKV